MDPKVIRGAAMDVYSQCGYAIPFWGGKHSWGGKGSSSSTSLGSPAHSLGNMMGNMSAFGHIAQVAPPTFASGLDMSQQVSTAAQTGIVVSSTTVVATGAESVSRDFPFQRFADQVGEAGSMCNLANTGDDEVPIPEQSGREFEKMLLRSATFKAMQREVNKVQRDVALVSTNVANLESSQKAGFEKMEALLKSVQRGNCVVNEPQTDLLPQQISPTPLQSSGLTSTSDCDAILHKCSIRYQHEERERRDFGLFAQTAA